MKLSEYSLGRDNNFNLIRILAALAVLVTHSFVLTTGSGDSEPFRNSLGMSISTIAVDVFFITSGFLVTSSLLNRQSAVDFIWARVLRIYPALIVMLLLTVFVLGTYFTTLPISSYLSSPTTHRYLTKCSTLFYGISYKLPGVFEANPLKGAVNGSLWTMPFEARMYAILAVVWLLLRLAPAMKLRGFTVLMVTFAVSAGFLVLARHLDSQPESHFQRLFYMFFTGAAFYVLRRHIDLSRSTFWLFAVCLLISLGNKPLFFAVYAVSVAYALLYLSYVPSGFIRHYNRLGDYSYGVYIYAFPVQQTVAALIPGVSVLQMIVLSGFTTLVLAVLSWHLLEKRCLGLRSQCVGQTRSLLAFARAR